MLKQFVKDSTIYGISGFITKGISILLVPFYTRVLNPADYGLIDYIAILGFFVGVIFSLEIYQAIARFYADFKSQAERVKYISSGFLFTLLVFSIFVALIFLFTDTWSKLLIGSDKYKLILRVSAFYILFNALFNYLLNVIRYRLESKNYTICSLTNTFITVALSILLVVRYRMGVMGIFYAQTAGVMIALFIALYFAKSSIRFQFSMPCVRELLTFSVPLVPLSIGVYLLLFIDRFFIKSLLDLSDLGVYGIAFRVASISSVIMGSLNSASTPLIYSKYKHKDTPAQLSRIFQYVVFGAIIITIFLSLFARELLVLFTTPDYYSAALLVPFLVASGFISKFYDYAPGLYIAKKTKFVARIYLTGAVFSTFSNYILIKSFGLIGAAISSVLSASLIFLVTLYYSQRLYFIPFQFKRIILSVIISAFLIIIGIKTHLGNLYLEYVFKIVVLSFSILILLWIKLIDFKKIISFVKRFLNR